MAIDDSPPNRAILHHTRSHPGAQGQKIGAGLPRQQEPGQEQLFPETIEHTVFTVQQIPASVQ